MDKLLIEAIEYLEKNFTDLYLTKDTVLPKRCENGLYIKWNSSNEDVVSRKGEIKETIFERYVELVAEIENGDEVAKKSFWCKVKPIDEANISEEEKLEKYMDALIPTSVKEMNFNQDYKNITQSFGLINLFDGLDPVIDKQIIKDGMGNKADEEKKSTEFVCVHDTANQRDGADAQAHSNFVNNGGGGCSWHFSVDDHSIIQQVKLDEVAFHAGDGTRPYGLNDTGVKATTKLPSLTFSEDNYYVLGGVKTNIKLPENTVYKRVGPYGIYLEIGENGNYWMNNSYYNEGFGWIANCGGNRNSVGFESCVNMTSDYVKTFVNAAKLSTWIVRKYGLSVDRILEHNNFSGKNCPHAIRTSGTWANFKDYCSGYKYGLDNFNGYKFEYVTSYNITNDGFINKNVGVNDEIDIKVIVSKDEKKVFEKEYKVIVK